MIAAVAGAAGFLGFHISERLLEEGYEVIGLDNLITGQMDNIRVLSGKKRFRFIAHDVTEYIDVPGRIDWVLNFACPASPIDYSRLPIKTLKVGSLGTYKTLGLALAKNAKYFLASSSEVYGDPQEHPQKESYRGHVDQLSTRGTYDEAKRFSEALAISYHRVHGIDTRIARIFNSYGPRLRKTDGRAVPAFICQALAGEPVTLFGSGQQTRSFCYVDDTVEGVFRLMSSSFNFPVNIGSPLEINIRELADKIIKLTGSSSRVIDSSLPDNDPKIRRPDISLAQEVLGWMPEISLEEGLLRTIEYFRERR